MTRDPSNPGPAKKQASTSEIKPELLARLHLRSRKEGGRRIPTPETFLSAQFYVGADGFDCRMLLDKIGSLVPGQDADVPIKFINPHLIMPTLRTGTQFILREGGTTIADGTIVEIFGKNYSAASKQQSDNSYVVESLTHQPVYLWLAFGLCALLGQALYRSVAFNIFVEDPLIVQFLILTVQVVLAVLILRKTGIRWRPVVLIGVVIGGWGALVSLVVRLLWSINGFAP